MTIFSKIQEFFSFNWKLDDSWVWVCDDCGKKFERKTPELFIKHQIDNKHYNCHKEPIE